MPSRLLTWDRCAGGRQWQVVDGTALFVDVAGFTALSERLTKRGRRGAEDLTEILDRRFSSLLQVAGTHGGELLKFGGDALYLLFDGADHPARACAAAASMRRTLATASEEGVPRIRASFGLHSGKQHLFRVGRSHLELVVTGPGATNTAAMEAAAGANEIVISPSTAARLDARRVGGARGDGFLLRTTTPWPEAQASPMGRVRGAARAIPIALRAELRSERVEPQHRNAAIAFVSFRGMDALLAERGPRRVAEVLETLVGDIQQTVDDLGVTFLGTDVDGDGGKVLLVAGVPRAHGDEADRLLRAVRVIADRHDKLSLRIGVNHGHVFAGAVGPAIRRTYTVMGDAVNVAARVAARAGEGQVVATTAALGMVTTTEFSTAPLPPFFVKGKAQPLDAVVVSAVGARRQGDIDDSAFIGRDDSLPVLAGAVAAVSTGKGAAFVVDGAPGIGKTRLVAEALTSCRSDTEVIWLGCDPFETNTPYATARRLVRRLLAADAAGLRRLARRAEPSVIPWLPLVGVVAGIDITPTGEVDALDPSFRRARTARAVVDLIAATREQPAVVVVDDAQWLDALSRDIVIRMAEALDEAWVVIVSGRGIRYLCPTAKRIALAPLTRDETVRLAEACTSRPVPPSLSDVLVDRSGGNPLFLLELLRGGVARDRLDAIPGTLEAVVTAELDALPAADRRLARHAAVLGMSFPIDLLVEISDVEMRRPADALRRLRRVLTPLDDVHARFRNPLFRDVAYEGLSFRRRRDLHAAAAAAIRRRAVDDTHYSAALSLHYLHADDHVACAAYAAMAADHAAEAYANADAAVLYERALRRGQATGMPSHRRRDMYRKLGDVLVSDGRYAEARIAYLRGRRLCGPDATSAALLSMKLARTALYEQRPTNALTWVRRGLREVAGQKGHVALTTRATLALMRANLHQRAGRPAAAARWARQAITDARLARRPVSAAGAYMLLDWSLVALGRTAEATNWRRAISLYEREGNLGRVGEGYVYAGFFEHGAGRLEQALDYFRRAEDAYARAGNVVDAALCAGNVVETLIDLERYAEAEPIARRVVDTFRRASSPLLEGALAHQRTIEAGLRRVVSSSTGEPALTR